MSRKSKKHKGSEESPESAGAKVDPHSSPASQDGAGVKHKMKRKQYEKEMRVLHGGSRLLIQPRSVRRPNRESDGEMVEAHCASFHGWRSEP